MKGLYLFDKDGKEFGYSIKDGGQVTIKARIYNYSFVDAQDVKVKFEAQESTDNKNWGALFEIGTGTIPTIPCFQNAQSDPNWEYAEVTFDTSGRAGKFYRFWVTIDPDKAIIEIKGHDWGDTYSNNEGYFGIPLAVVSEASLANMSGHNLLHKDGSDARAGIGDYFRFYNTERPHQSLGYRTPAEVFASSQVEAIHGVVVESLTLDTLTTDSLRVAGPNLNIAPILS